MIRFKAAGIFGLLPLAGFFGTACMPVASAPAGFSAEFGCPVDMMVVGDHKCFQQLAGPGAHCSENVNVSIVSVLGKNSTAKSEKP